MSKRHNASSASQSEMPKRSLITGNAAFVSLVYAIVQGNAGGREGKTRSRATMSPLARNDCSKANRVAPITETIEVLHPAQEKSGQAEHKNVISEHPGSLAEASGKHSCGLFSPCRG